MSLNSGNVVMDEEELTALRLDLERAETDCDRAMQLNTILTEALKSIAANTCCDKCQEAALVARAALTKAGA